MTDPLSAEQRTRFDAINRDLSRTVTVFLTPADFRALWIMVKQHDRLARVLEIERLQWRRHLPCPDCRDKVTEGDCERCGRQQAESALTALRADHARLREAATDVVEMIAEMGLALGSNRRIAVAVLALREALAGAPEETGAAKCCSGEPITDGGLPSDGPIYPGDPAHCPACAASAEPTKEPR